MTDKQEGGCPEIRRKQKASQIRVIKNSKFGGAEAACEREGGGHGGGRHTESTSVIRLKLQPPEHYITT